MSNIYLKKKNILFLIFILINLSSEQNFNIISNFIFPGEFEHKNGEDFVEASLYDVSAQEKYIEEILETLRRPKPNYFFEGIEITRVANHSQPQKDWTILIYIAGDNDLYKFALRNIEQMKQVGSNNLLNILIHFDYHENGKAKQTKRFYVEKNNLLEIGALSAMDSGDQKTLISAAQWAIKDYPSENFALVLWNHGSGDLNPMRFRLIDPSELFYYDTITRQIILDRSISFTDFLLRKAFERGICFDDTTDNYLDDDKLSSAFEAITKFRASNNSKKKNFIDVVLMDACLMGGIGTAYLCSKYAEFMTASQEVVPGPGYDYANLLKPLSKGKVSTKDFCVSVVECYKNTYSKITQDFTESALDLKNMNQLIRSIEDFINTVFYFSKYDKQNVIKRTLKICADKNICTHFEEPTYLDLIDFFDNVSLNISNIKIEDENKISFINLANHNLKRIKEAHSKVVLRSAVGKSYKKATGLSLYIPGSYIDRSFASTIFGKNTKWLSFLRFLI
jgi:hypothetical protein